MKNFDLTNYVESIENNHLNHLSRIGPIFIGSKLNETIPVEFFSEKDIKTVIDLKLKTEDDFNDELYFSSMPIKYFHFPVSGMDSLTQERLVKFKELLDHNSNNILVYCGSGNRVAAILGLMFCFVCGHPRQRSLEIAQKIGLTKKALLKAVENRILKQQDNKV